MGTPEARPAFDRGALAALLLSNLVLVVLALLNRWTWYAPLLLFWIETLIIGVFNVFRMMVVSTAGNPFGRWVGFSGPASAIF